MSFLTRVLDERNSLSEKLIDYYDKVLFPLSVLIRILLWLSSNVKRNVTYSLKIEKLNTNLFIVIFPKLPSLLFISKTY